MVGTALIEQHELYLKKLKKETKKDKQNYKINLNKFEQFNKLNMSNMILEEIIAMDFSKYISL